MKNTNWAIGVDLGGTKIEAAHVDKEGNIQDRVRVKTDVAGGVDAVISQIEKLAKQLTKQASTPPASLGIGVAGQINKETGVVQFAPNLKWNHVSLDEDLEGRLDLPVTVLNDVRAAAWGEWLHGAAKGARDMICIFIGTGIGGGIVSKGQMLDGASNVAGEIGHMTVQIDGPKCHCGNIGCLEALAGSWAIERDARMMVAKKPKAGAAILEFADGEIMNIKAKHVIKAFKNGDELATQLIDDVIEAVGAGLASLTNALNPEVIIMGGGVTEHMPDMIPRVEEIIRKRALDAAVAEFKITETNLHDDSGVIGAAAYTFRKEQQKQDQNSE